MKRIVLAITGASGAVYARRLGQEIVQAGVELHLVVSPHGLRVLADELGVRRLNVAAILGGAAERALREHGESVPEGAATLHSYRDIGDVLASGSFRTDGMVICPCSSNTLAAVAAGLADTLVTRAALVTLKEGRRLIVVPREMPLSQIEIANMLRLSQAGALVCPACPGFYLRPQSVGELVDFVVGRVLDLLGLEHDLRVRWEDERARAAGRGAGGEPDARGEDG
ncbi:MAG: flavin prenyltransferase UbiX [Planctomycetota bacterium]